MSCKDECFKNPKHPDNKCCFNCGRDSSLCDSLHVCGSDCCNWKPKDDERRILIDIPADGNYIEILGHRIDGFESFEAFLEHLKNYVVLEETVKAQKAEIERLATAYPKTIESIKKMYATAKAEAVKEFAERFENELTKIEEIYFDEEHENFISANKVIALLVNLVKEMAGEVDAT